MNGCVWLKWKWKKKFSKNPQKLIMNLYTRNIIKTIAKNIIKSFFPPTFHRLVAKTHFPLLWQQWKPSQYPQSTITILFFLYFWYLNTKHSNLKPQFLISKKSYFFFFSSSTIKKTLTRKKYVNDRKKNMSNETKYPTKKQTFCMPQSNLKIYPIYKNTASKKHNPNNQNSNHLIKIHLGIYA